MLQQKATKTINQSINLIENHYFKNETHYNQSTLKERWSHYAEIFNQFKSLKRFLTIQEVEYRVIHEGENINNVICEVINEDDELYLILYPFIYVMEEYADFDAIKNFL